MMFAGIFSTHFGQCILCLAYIVGLVLHLQSNVTANEAVVTEKMSVAVVHFQPTVEKIESSKHDFRFEESRLFATDSHQQESSPRLKLTFPYFSNSITISDFGGGRALMHHVGATLFSRPPPVS